MTQRGGQASGDLAEDFQISFSQDTGVDYQSCVARSWRYRPTPLALSTRPPGSAISCHAGKAA